MYIWKRRSNMTYKDYQKSYFKDPQPQPKYQLKSSFYLSLFYKDYEAAIAYYSVVLGPPAYEEGEDTKGWPIGSGWLTLFPDTESNPKNVEVMLQTTSPAEAESLQRALIEAGGKGEKPTNQFMYTPIRYCPVIDPFGVSILVFSELESY
jgi:hypothetical protein